MSFKTRFIQFRKLGLGLRLAFKKSEGEGDISNFGALCTSLAACLGTGNIVGVALAVSSGGPGSIFWMVLSAFFGMATKYSEGVLGLKYREKIGNSFIGGTFLYIKKGLGFRFSFFSKFFAFFGMAAGLIGIGGIAQINTVSLSLEGFLDPDKSTLIEGTPYTLCLVICGIITALAAGFALLGGIKRISAISCLLVPLMAVIFLICSFIIIASEISLLGDAVLEIFRSAFSIKAGVGALAGIGIKEAISEGIGRGVFSNEAGIGTASISAASSKENEPTRAGLISMVGTFIDTIVLCPVSGLAIILTGAASSSSDGSKITSIAWEKGLPFPNSVSSGLLTLCLFFFGFTSIIGWSSYSLKCAEYLFNGRKKAMLIYKSLYIFALLIGPFLSISFAFKIADLCNAFMALPNLLALILLSGRIKSETESFFKRNQKIKRKMLKDAKSVKKL